MGGSGKSGITLINGIPIKGSITFARNPVGRIRLIDLRCKIRVGYNFNSFNIEMAF